MFVTARKVIDDDYCIIMDGTYSDIKTRLRCKSYFRQCCEDGKIRSGYEENTWYTHNGVNPCGINFMLDKKKYKSYGMRYVQMEYEEMIEAMKIYAIWCMGEYDFRGIQRRIRCVKRVLENVGDKNLTIDESGLATITEFLDFIDISAKNKNSIKGRIKTNIRKRGKPRKLKHMAIYAVAADKSKELMQYGTQKEKLKYFPVYLLTNLGPRIPLRATEWTLMPYHCLEKTEEGYFLTVRRTILKKGGRKVENDVDKDYKLFTYNIPYTDDIQMIEWYVKETKSHKRKFLFDYDESSGRDNLRERFSLQSLNELITEFVEEYIKDSAKYTWILKMTGAEKFEPFTAGDMRPIALINLYYSGVNLDVCMELADHDNMETTYHYIRNIEEFIETANFMKMQKRINDERRDIERIAKKDLSITSSKPLGCDSYKLFRGDLSDCDPRCLDDRSCVICRHHTSTKKEVEEYIDSKKKQLEKEVEAFRQCIRNEHGPVFDNMLIRLQKAAEDYNDACTILAEQEYEKWKSMKEGIG